MPPKSTGPKPDNPKTVERIIGNFFTRMLYAHSKDLEIAFADKPPGTNHIEFNHYDNFIATGTNKIKLAARFTPGTRVEQALRMIWEDYICNLRDNIEMVPGDTFDKIKEKLNDYDEASPGAFIFRIWDNNLPLVRDCKTLYLAYDDGKLRAEFAKKFAKFAASEDLMAIIVSTFTGFLRAVALNISAANWYGKTSIEALYWGYLIANGLTQDHILGWRSDMRPEKERKPKDKSAAEPSVDAAAPTIQDDIDAILKI